MSRRARVLATALAIFLLGVASQPGAARAAQAVQLSASFTPDRLGSPTTISFGFQISAGAQVPSPVTGIDLRYPVNLGLATSDLGLAVCSPRALEKGGPASCPANSRMGHGEALAEIPVGPEVVKELASITLLSGPSREGHLNFLVYADGETPVSAQLVFSALLLPEPAPFGGRLHFDVPLVPSLPEASDVAIVHLQTTLGPLGLTYYENVHGRTIAYHPTGIMLPMTCPRHGFPFVATLYFQDGTHTEARTTVPCPARAHAHS